MNRPKTRLATLYRFVPGMRASHEEMFDSYTQYVSAQSLDERHADIEFIEVAEAPAIWIGLPRHHGLAPQMHPVSVVRMRSVTGLTGRVRWVDDS